jgi:hypothetical protein
MMGKTPSQDQAIARVDTSMGRCQRWTRPVVVTVTRYAGKADLDRRKCFWLLNVHAER